MSDSVSEKIHSNRSIETMDVTGIGNEIYCEKRLSSSELCLYRRLAEEPERNKVSNASSVYKSSEEFFEYNCRPCYNKGYHMEAQDYCSECREYLCDACAKSHSRNKISEHHNLLGKGNMPKILPFCDMCKTADVKVESAGYCTDCRKYLCKGCCKSHLRSTVTGQHVLLDNDKKSTSTGNTPRNINAKANQDQNECFIGAMTLVTKNVLVLADCKNQSLKLVDLENDIIKDSLKLQAFPAGLTTISENQVAVVKHKIQIVSVTEKLSVIRTLNTGGNSIDVKYVNGKLYLSFHDPVKFQIIHLTGTVYKTIYPKTEVLKHCTLSLHIAVTHDESIIYISDWKSRKVLGIDMNGNMKFMFTGQLNSPQDLTISPGNSVYLCDRNLHVVYKMRLDLSDCTALLVQGDGLFSPQAICFNAEKQNLYVSSGSEEAEHCNFIKVFKCF